MSHLVDIDPDTTQPEEELGCEFGYYIFDSLLPISVEEVCTIDLIPSITITDPDNETHLLLDPKDPGGDVEKFLELLNHEHYEVVSSLQDQDTFCHKILTFLRCGKLINKHVYTIQKDILRRIMTIDNARFLPIVLPSALIGHMLSLAHDHLGHNGISRTYAMVRRLYFWKGMKSSITKYIKNCNICQKRNLQIVPYVKLHFDAATFPMEFISMDFVGEFYPPSKSGHKYALTVICMLTGYVFCIPLRTKQASEVVQAYIDNVYAKFGGSLKILSDNGTEFKNHLFE